MRVEIYTLVNGEDTKLGDIFLREGRLIPRGDGRLKSILNSPVIARGGGRRISPAEDPAGWLEGLQYHYRSAYLRASAPINNVRGRVGRKSLHEPEEKPLSHQDKVTKPPEERGQVEELPEADAGADEPEAPRSESPEAAAKRAKRQEAQGLAPPKAPEPEPEPEPEGLDLPAVKESPFRPKAASAAGGPEIVPHEDEALNRHLSRTRPGKEDAKILRDAADRFGLVLSTTDRFGLVLSPTASSGENDEYVMIAPAKLHPGVFRDYLIDQGLNPGSIRPVYQGGNVQTLVLRLPPGTDRAGGISNEQTYGELARNNAHWLGVAVDRPLPREFAAWLNGQRAENGPALRDFANAMAMIYDRLSEPQGYDYRDTLDHFDTLATQLRYFRAPGAEQFLDTLRQGYEEKLAQRERELGREGPQQQRYEQEPYEYEEPVE